MDKDQEEQLIEAERYAKAQFEILAENEFLMTMLATDRARAIEEWEHAKTSEERERIHVKYVTISNMYRLIKSHAKG